MRHLVLLPGWLHRLRYYGLALLLVAATALLRLTLTHLVGPGLSTYLTFYPGVMLVALIGGLGPGLLATLAAALVVHYWLLPPEGLFGIERAVDAVGLVFFFAMGVFMSVVAGLYRRTRDHLEELVTARTAALGQANGHLKQEIAERRQAEEALRESEERYHRFFEDDLTGDFISAPDGQILLCNPAFAAMFRFSSAQDAVGTSILDLYVDPGERDPLLERLRRQGRIERLELWRKRRDGEPIYVVENLVGHFNDRGELYEIKGYLFDDTDRKQAEEALRRSERQFKSTFENAAIGIAHVALDGHIMQFNSRFCEISGYPSGDIVGKTCEEITFAGDWEAEKEQIQRLRDGGIAHYSIEKRYVRMDGSPVWVNLTRSIQRDDAGKPEHFIVLVEDISQRKRAEEALRDLTATLENRVAERTAEVAHRVRQLQKLAVEVSETEDRERRRLAEILHDDLQQILAGAKFHLGLMRNRAKYDPLLQAAAAEIDHMLKDAIEKSRSLSHELSPAVLHHGDFAETLGWLAGQIQAKHGLLVHVHAYGQVHSQSDALKAFLYKAAQEMLFNIVKHARVNEARIRVRRLGRCICLSVSDRGRGFDPQELGGAAGFGLLSIRERVESLGGRMKIKSAKGQGSTFFITVPDGEEPEDTEQAGGPRREAVGASLAWGLQPPASGARLRVLLADDHEIVREGLLSLLGEEHAIEVVGEAANGREAVELAGRLEPDVVIMDVSMPLIDGDEATRQIKMHLPKTRVIALSMYEQAEMVERMYRAGAESYVLKTAPSEELLAAIRGKGSDS